MPALHKKLRRKHSSWRLPQWEMQKGESDFLPPTNYPTTCARSLCIPLQGEQDVYKPQDFTPWTHPNRCVDATTRRNGRVLAVRCTDFCENKSTQRLQDGTPCLLNYERKVPVPTVSDLIVEGICKNGQCIITPPTVPVLMFHVPAEACDHFVSSVNYTAKVETTCSAFCPRKTTKSVKRGTHCALKTAGRWWPRVTEVGQCVDQPASIKLIVVAPCQVECGYSVFEHRLDGVKCLLEYSRMPTKRNSRAGLGMYKVGVCKGGYCTLGKHPQNITTDD
ncbi:uncharacterized protein [Dermacentor albipictus]|uniref:uncharacterized protein n=1 Tax=Dermacentor albipictus TaxID=60249 RepID=UPI0038FD2750